MQDITVVGAGGLGREIAAVLQQHFSDNYRLIGFIDDGLAPGKVVNELPVLGGVEWLQRRGNCAVALGLGRPLVRQSVYQKLQGYGLSFPNIIHPGASLHAPDFITMGEANYIAQGVILTVNISLGNGNLLNLHATLGHDVVLHNFVSVMPGVHLSGGATLSSESYIGTGANLIKATLVGKGATVGAGALVNLDIPAGETWAGIPAQRLK